MLTFKSIKRYVYEDLVVRMALMLCVFAKISPRKVERALQVFNFMLGNVLGDIPEHVCHICGYSYSNVALGRSKIRVVAIGTLVVPKDVDIEIAEGAGSVGVEVHEAIDSVWADGGFCAMEAEIFIVEYEIEGGMVSVFCYIHSGEFPRVIVTWFAIVSFEVLIMNGPWVEDHDTEHIVECVEDALEDVGSQTMMTEGADKFHGMDVENVFALALFELLFPTFLDGSIIVNEGLYYGIVASKTGCYPYIIELSSSLPIEDFDFELTYFYDLGRALVDVAIVTEVLIADDINMDAFAVGLFANIIGKRRK